MIVIAAGGGEHMGFAVSLAQRLEGKAEMLFIVSKGDWLNRRRLEKYGCVVETTKPREPMRVLLSWLYCCLGLSLRV
ncbi:MAG: hypothetical protein QXP97_05575 [Desulfurococcus sp.]|uniref:hypothetical protein n=1 Tax=Desulfurococcus sp. TaxID=51678 RepID=UPI0031666F2F